MSVDMNKTIAEASLDNLHDIIIPEAVGCLPPAPGWYMLGLLLLALLGHFVMNAYKRYKKSLYKREALVEVGRYKEESKEDMIHLLTLAKRVAITAYGREEIAKLSGDSWWDFMEQHSKAKVSKELRVQIAYLLYDRDYDHDSVDYPAIKNFVTLWIKTHKVSDHV